MHKSDRELRIMFLGLKIQILRMQMSWTYSGFLCSGHLYTKGQTSKSHSKKYLVPKSSDTEIPLKQMGFLQIPTQRSQKTDVAESLKQLVPAGEQVSQADTGQCTVSHSCCHPLYWDYSYPTALPFNIIQVSFLKLSLNMFV